jgi:hypothetical protein
MVLAWAIKSIPEAVYQYLHSQPSHNLLLLVCYKGLEINNLIAAK